jgi:hypothetical protein
MNSHPSGDADLAAFAAATVSLRNQKNASRVIRQVSSSTQA